MVYPVGTIQHCNVAARETVAFEPNCHELILIQYRFLPHSTPICGGMVEVGRPNKDDGGNDGIRDCGQA
jgi:hypothetical protein